MASLRPIGSALLALGLASCQALPAPTERGPMAMPAPMRPVPSRTRQTKPPDPVIPVAVPAPVAEPAPAVPIATAPCRPEPIVPAVVEPSPLAVGPRADALLLPLLHQEQALLEDFGPEHPQVKAVRARIAAVERYLEEHPAPPPAEIARTSAVEPAPLPALVPVEAPTPQPCPSPPVVVTVAPSPPPAAPSMWKLALSQFVGTAAALLFGLVVQIAGLAVLLRRYVPQLGPLLRVEVATPPITVMPMPTAPASAVVPSRPVVDEEPLPANPAEAGILQQLFQDNLRMRAELASLPDE